MSAAPCRDTHSAFSLWTGPSLLKHPVAGSTGEPKEVRIAEGVYRLTSPLGLDSKDSHTVWAAGHKGADVTISGGQFLLEGLMKHVEVRRPDDLL